VEQVDRVAVLAGALPRGRPRAIARNRVPLMPLRLRKRLLNEADLFGDRRRGEGLGQEPEARAPPYFLCVELSLDCRQEIAPPADLTAKEHRLQPIRIVEAENGRLREDVGSSKTGWMLRIPFDFGRMPLVAFHEHRYG